jgi:hypothetical protein
MNYRHPQARRTAEGLSKKEVICCLDRYIARELYKILTRPKPEWLEETIFLQPLDEHRRIPQPIIRSMQFMRHFGIRGGCRRAGLVEDLELIKLACALQETADRNPQVNLIQGDPRWARGPLHPQTALTVDHTGRRPTPEPQPSRSIR